MVSVNLSAAIEDGEHERGAHPHTVTNLPPVNGTGIGVNLNRYLLPAWQGVQEHGIRLQHLEVLGLKVKPACVDDPAFESA